MEEKIVKPKTNQQAPTPKAKTVATPIETSEPQVETDSKVEQLQKLTDAETATKVVDVDKLIPSDPYYMDPLFYEVANYFGLQQEDYDGAKLKLADIVEHVIRDIEDNQPDKVLMKIRQIENLIQPPAWDEKRYSNVHKYIRLAQKKSTISQAMKAFEKEAGNGS